MYDSLIDILDLVWGKFIDPIYNAINDSFMVDFFDFVRLLISNILRLINNDNYILIEDINFTYFVAMLLGVLLLVLIFKLLYNIFVICLNTLRGLGNDTLKGINTNEKNNFKTKKRK